VVEKGNGARLPQADRVEHDAASRVVIGKVKWR
jgi:hypothetical protein